MIAVHEQKELGGRVLTVGDINRRLRRIEADTPTLAARRGTAETGDDDE